MQIDWDKNENYYRAWEEARTGYPWIDAIMTQLREQGWMHHLARHAVVSHHHLDMHHAALNTEGALKCLLDVVPNESHFSVKSCTAAIHERKQLHCSHS